MGRLNEKSHFRHYHRKWLSFILAVKKEIQNVHACAGFRPVKLRIAAVCTGYGNEFFVLDIKNFGKVAAGGLHLIGNVAFTAAFGADILFLFHGMKTSLFVARYGKPF